MPDAAIVKVEDAFANLLRAATDAGRPLEGWTVITAQSTDEKIEPDKWPALPIYTTAYEVEPFDGQDEHLHTATLEFEFISGKSALGPISRRNQNAIATAQGVIARDRVLGGMLQLCEEVDVAPATPNGKDVGSASIQYRVQFITPRDDWFTIRGQGGTDF